VQQALTKALSELDAGTFVMPGAKMTVAKFFDNWLASRKTGVRIRTYERYRSRAQKHIIPTLGRTLLDKLMAMQVQALLDKKFADGLSARSVLGIRILLAAAWKQAMRWQLVPRNVAELVNVPRVENQEMRVLSPEQARTFLTACRGEPLFPLWLLALSSGLRRGEMLALSWADLDLDRGTLLVRRSISRSQTAGLVISEPKPSRGRRTVRLSEPIVVALRTHRTRQLERRLSAGPDWKEADYVFTSSIGTPIDAKALAHVFTALLEKAKLPRIRIHDLRHSAVTIALAEGIHPKSVSAMLGHSRISLTLDVYSHSLPTLQVEAADKMAKALTGRV
jgi:integrase